MIVERIRKSLLIIRTCKNWHRVLWQYIFGEACTGVLLRNGLSVTAPQNLLPQIEDIIDRQVYCSKCVAIEPNDVIVDIGANIGMFTLVASQRTRNKVFSFEPLPLNYEYLQRNIATNNCANVTTYNCAVSGMSKTEKLYLSKFTGGNILYEHTCHTTEGQLDSYIVVPCISLEDMMRDNNIEQIDLLKLDCEGSEGSILSAASEVTLLRIRKIVMEFHDNVSVLSHERLLARLQEAQFKTDLVWEGSSPFGYIYASRD